jgi:hypothetical protein
MLIVSSHLPLDVPIQLSVRIPDWYFVRIYKANNALVGLYDYVILSSCIKPADQVKTVYSSTGIIHDSIIIICGSQRKKFVI